MIKLLLASLFVITAAQAQVFHLTHDELVQYTSKNPFGRFEDGRPKVPDALLEKVKGLSLEEIWAVLPEKGYKNQYPGDHWRIMHPEKKLVGRAVTLQFMPARPDLSERAEAAAQAKFGRHIAPHQRVIDMLQPGDVLVVGLFGTIQGGTIVGDNLATAIWSASHTGFVVDGALRDLEGIYPIGMPVYYRGADPTPIDYSKVMVTGVNVPVQIGNSTVMPGDVVFGDREGLYFIPPQFVQEIVNRAEETHAHDDWTKDKFMHGRYKSSDLYPRPADPAVRKEYEEYKKKRLGKE